MSSPVVAGVVALLLQKDPTLTQDKILALLQAGAHRFRGVAPFDDQSGPGEVDAMGALDALEQMRNPELQLPAAAQSWLTLSSDYVPADGSTAVTAIVELRTGDAKHRADFFDKKRLGSGAARRRKAVRGQRWRSFVAGPACGSSRGSRRQGSAGRARRSGRRSTGSRSSRRGPFRSRRIAGMRRTRAMRRGVRVGWGAGTGTGTGTGTWGSVIAILMGVAAVRRRKTHSAASVTSHPCGSQTSSSGSKR